MTNCFSEIRLIYSLIRTPHINNYPQANISPQNGNISTHLLYRIVLPFAKPTMK